MRELETIRSFLTGQGLFSALDLFFTFVFIAVLFAYSWKLTLIVLASIPLYLVIAAMAPAAAARAAQREVQSRRRKPAVPGRNDRRHADHQGGRGRAGDAQRNGRSGSRPMSARPSAPPCSAPRARTPSNMSTSSSTAALLLFGAKAVIDGELTVGELVAFNMIAAPDHAADAAPVAAVAGFPAGAGLGRAARRHPQRADRADPGCAASLPPPRGQIEFRNVSLPLPPGLAAGAQEDFSCDQPRRGGRHRRPLGLGQVDAHQADPALLHARGGPGPARRQRPGQVDPAWLRSHIGVVLQENLLFNRTIHENIALSNPAMPRAPGDGDRQARRRRRIHRQIAEGLRHHDRGARRQPIRRPAPAHRHRPGADHQSADPDLRRGDQRARLRERADHPAQHAPDRAEPDGVHHRASPRGGARLRPHRRHDRRADGRGRLARRIAEAIRKDSTPGCGRCRASGKATEFRHERPQGSAGGRNAAPKNRTRASPFSPTGSSCPPTWKSWRRRPRRCAWR